MPLSLTDIHRIAQLARIDIDAPQAEATLAQLTDIFRMIEQIQQVNTDGVEPMAHPLGGVQRLREDRVTEQVDRDASLRNAPAQHQGLFLVPRVLE